MGSRPSLASDVTMNSVLTADQQAKYQDPQLIRSVLTHTKTIAIAGLSPNRQRPSHFVGSYLNYEGYRVIPVNPRVDTLFGEKGYRDLLSIPDPVDTVNVFRRPEECIEIVKQAIEIGAKTVWMQLRVVNLEAAELAEEAGLNVIMDKCLKIEHGRYNGSLHWVGMNTELISARRGKRYF